MSASEKATFMKKVMVPLVAFVIFMLPILNQAFQTEVQSSSSIPVHWQFVVSAAIGGAISTLVSIMRKYFDLYKEDLDKEVEALKNKLEKKDLERDIAEKEIMLTAARGNADWLDKNDQIGMLNKQIAALEDQLKKKKE